MARNNDSLPSVPSSKIKFGKKNKYVLVPDGWVIMRPSARLVQKECRNRSNDLIHHQDRYFNLLSGKFEELCREDFEDLDGNQIDLPIDGFDVLIRDRRGLYGNTDYYPVGTTLICTEDGEWREE